MRRITCVGALLIGAVFGFPAGSASSVSSTSLVQRADEGGIGIRLLEAPVARRDDPRAQVAVVDHVAPGTVVERAFEVSNTTSEPQVVKAYVGPAQIKGGQFAVANPGEQNELTGWSSTSESRISLAPGAAQAVELAIQVPEDAAEGERYGVVWASVAAADGQVNAINRVGIRVYLSVGPGGEPPSDFEIESLQPGRTPRGLPYVDATVTNTGGRALDPRGQLALRGGPGDLRAGPFDVGPLTLAPNETRPVRVTLDKSTPPGPWQARLVLRSGSIEKRASAEITFPDFGVGSAVEAEDETAWWQSWPFLVGLALVLLLLALLLWLLRRRRRTDEDEVTPQPEVVATP